MTDDEMLGSYRDLCQMDVTVRRYTGASGSRTATDYAAKGYFRQYSAKEIVGTIAQGDLQLFAITADLVTAGLALPLTVADRAVLGGKERQVMSIGERKNNLTGTLIAYEAQVRG